MANHREISALPLMARKIWLDDLALRSRDLADGGKWRRPVGEHAAAHRSIRSRSSSPLLEAGEASVCFGYAACPTVDRRHPHSASRRRRSSSSSLSISPRAKRSLRMSNGVFAGGTCG